MSRLEDGGALEMKANSIVSEIRAETILDGNGIWRVMSPNQTHAHGSFGFCAEDLCKAHESRSSWMYKVHTML